MWLRSTTLMPASAPQPPFTPNRSQWDREQRHELLAACHVGVAGRTARQQPRDAHLDGQRGAEVEDAHVLGGNAVKAGDDLGGDHLALSDVVERGLVWEEQV